jgi:hypothetical protein
MDILDLSIVQIDAPYAADALAELNRSANLVVTAFDVGEDMKGWEFAMRVKKASVKTAVLILGNVDDPDEFDAETAHDSPFVYMSRPVDIHQFLRVLVGGLESHEAMLNALHTPVAAATGGDDMGPVPLLNTEAAQGILDGLLTDLGAMAIILTTRDGTTLLERGAVGYIDRDRLAQTLMPVMKANIGLRDVVGGNLSSVQLYDGDDYDIFILTVGLHHVLAVIFDGAQGSRQFGLVNRFGRRAVEDLIAIIGADAFFIQQVSRADALPHRPAATRKAQPEEDAGEELELARAEISFRDEDEEEADAESFVQLEAIAEDEFNLDDLFGSGDAPDQSMDDLFDPAKLEEIAKENAPQRRGAISWDEAGDLGLLKK